MKVMLALVSGLVFWGLAGAASAGTVTVAVAANFTATAERLATAFAARTGDRLVLSFGSTGGLYAQISQGAPFEVFLAADDVLPAKAIAEGLAVGDAFTYAVGALALYSKTLDLSAGAGLLDANFERLAIADPATAPYGRAAVETLMALRKYEAMVPKLVTGENISQTLQFVESGNAELGFVAMSQMGAQKNFWRVPAALHQPIRQDAVLLERGENDPFARAFMDFLRGSEARAIIGADGYGLPDPVER
ncbi:molybdate ABC transporter substrate-binding protein [Devosia rhodophyticola]|uniref:Molybdate ABC transporter substrate-binding protein n=1 Tax=Devosia rhodophyticola TaxID=3026423 RepID=A0ABY7YU14_9HYPH|nr:molybdate ABC transporter substrate-binding protein [Devosia rhodophyticola]WDR04838.1 molybdate ABC transporter substrate-binding protein [Devosia rhodophyticola]